MTLFDTEPSGRVRHSDPQTSVDAARGITGRTELEILAHFEKHDEWDGGWTAQELCDDLDHIYGPTLVSALTRLHKAGVVRATGVTRPSRRGREQIAWRLA